MGGTNGAGTFSRFRAKAERLRTMARATETARGRGGRLFAETKPAGRRVELGLARRCGSALRHVRVGAPAVAVCFGEMGGGALYQSRSAQGADAARVDAGRGARVWRLLRILCLARASVVRLARQLVVCVVPAGHGPGRTLLLPGGAPLRRRAARVAHRHAGPFRGETIGSQPWRVDR